MKKRVFIILYLILYYQMSFSYSAKELFGVDKIDPRLEVGGNDLIFTLNNILGYIIGLFYFIAVAFGIYGGFMILVSGGDEDKVKKGKNIVLYMVYGLIVIFLASQIINWVISVMSDKNITG